MKLFTFATDDKYLESAEALKRSAELYGLDCTIFRRPHLDTWWKNVNQKCEVFAEALDAFPGEEIVYNDADCRYVGYPILFDELSQHDLASTFMNGNKHPISGTVYFNGERSRRYVDAFIRNVRKFPTHEEDTMNYRWALRTMPRPNIFHLPPAYCWIESWMRPALPGVKPIIMHTTDGRHDYPVKFMEDREAVKLYATSALYT